MSGARDIFARFRRDESGSLVEFAFVIVLFLLLLLGAIDFGRLGYSMVMAQKATERAVRLAVVSGPVCAGLPNNNWRGTATEPKYGTPCDADSTICADPGTTACTADASDAGKAIWNAVAPLMPTGATAANLRMTYTYDASLGFLGGPYTPVVSADITGLTFDFISPLGALAELAIRGTGPAGLGESFTFPGLSASLPAEDLS